MIRAFWFLTWRSAWNRTIGRLKKIRSPRYAISLAAGLAYVWFFAFRHIGSRPNISGIPASAVAVDFTAIFVFASLLLPWAVPDSSGGLTFSAAEIQFLFPAPVRRRDLILYKVFRQQPSIFISALMMTLFGFRRGMFVGLWATFMALSVYYIAVSLGRARLAKIHIGFIARLVIVLLIAAATIFLMVRDIQHTAASVPDMRVALRSGEPLFRSMPVRVVLFVPSLLANAVVPATTNALIFGIAAALLFAFVMFRVASALDFAFEDASLEASQRKAEMMMATLNQRLGRRVVFRRIPPPFRLSGTMPPEVAIVWKNLTACFRMSIAWIFLIVVIFAAFLVDAAIVRSEGARIGAVGIGLIFCAFFPFLGSQVLRQDLRLDLPRIELLKSFPLTGERILAAQMAAPALIVSIIELLLLIATAAAAQMGNNSGRLAFAGTPEFIVVALLFAIPVCAAQLLLHNAVAILLPGWAIQSAEESRGFAVLGQRLVILGANIIVLAVALIPAAIVFIPLFLLARHYGSNPFVLAVSTAPSVALLMAEIWLSIRFLGAQFDRIDITNEIDAAL